MTTRARRTEPTIDAGVQESLDALAANPSTAARYLDACDAIRDFTQTLAVSLTDAVKRHSPQVTTQDGIKYLVFVIPSPLVMFRLVDTFCIIYQADSARFHVHRYANCNSMREYEETRSKMRLEASNHDNIAKILLDAGSK
jgi:hypothetical protein